MEKMNKVTFSLIFILFYLLLSIAEVIIFGPQAMVLSAEKGKYLVNPVLYSIFNLMIIGFLLYSKETKYILKDFCKVECSTKIGKFVYVGTCVFMFCLTAIVLIFAVSDICGFIILSLGFIKVSIYLAISLFGLRKQV